MALRFYLLLSFSQPTMVGPAPPWNSQERMSPASAPSSTLFPGHTSPSRAPPLPFLKTVQTAHPNIASVFPLPLTKLDVPPANVKSWANITITFLLYSIIIFSYLIQQDKNLPKRLRVCLVHCSILSTYNYAGLIAGVYTYWVRDQNYFRPGNKIKPVVLIVAEFVKKAA